MTQITMLTPGTRLEQIRLGGETYTVGQYGVEAITVTRERTGQSNGLFGTSDEWELHVLVVRGNGSAVLYPITGRMTSAIFPAPEKGEDGEEVG